MADPLFFHRRDKITLKDIVTVSGCTVAEGIDLATEFEDVAPLSTAQGDQVSFLDNVKYKNDFISTKAGACFVSPEMEVLAPEGVICLVTDTPYKSYALAAQHFYPRQKHEGQVEQSAFVHPTAEIGTGVYIGHNVVIRENVCIGNNSYIGDNTIIGRSVRIGDECVCDGNITISHAMIGDFVRIYPGVRIGQDGFGFAIDPNGHVKVPQLGRVIVEDHVEIGANTTIDRGAGPDTIIGQGTWIDNLVQIGHNVELGKGCVIVAQVGISGSTKIGNFVAIGGQSGVAGHLKIGDGAQIGAQSGVMNDVPPMSEYMGSPAFPRMTFLRQVAALNRLIKTGKKD